MADPRLIDYVRKNLQLGYTEEQLRNTLITAGYNMRDIEDALASVIRPQELKQQAPSPQPEGEKGFFERLPLWMILSGAAGVVLLVVIIVMLIPSGEGPAAILSQQGIKVSAYDFNCAGPASALTLTIKNVGAYDLMDLQLFKDDMFQQGQLIPSLGTGASATYTYSTIDCMDWVGAKKIKIVSNKATAEGAITFKCSSGACA